MKKQITAFAKDVVSSLATGKGDNISISAHNYGLEADTKTIAALRKILPTNIRVEGSAGFLGYITFRTKPETP